MIDLSPLLPALNGKPIAIVGLGKSGMPVFEACRRAGIDCVLWDDTPAQRDAAAGTGATIEDLGAAGADISRFALVCLSPGIPLTHPKPHPVAAKAAAAGVPVIGDIELFHRARANSKTIAITGTNGKSTTTALTGHILTQAKIATAVGGNIGEAVLTLPALPSGGVYTLELSSYQIDLLQDFHPTIAAHINFSPDHLDRHGSMDGYVAAKERLFRGAGTAIIGIDDKWSAAMAERIKKKGERRVTAVSCQRPLAHGVFVSHDGVLFDGDKMILNINTCPALKGQHNWQNAAIAYAVAKAAGADAAAIINGLHSFPGLAHRQHIVTALHGVTYINDSKATNDQAASMALRTFGTIYWIAGGKPKDGGYADCEKYLSHVRHAFLIGEAETAMSAWLTARKIPHTLCGTLEKATEAAHKMSLRDRADKAVVLLSPACASFDQFRNFEHRGDVFAETVRRLVQAETAKTTRGGIST